MLPSYEISVSKVVAAHHSVVLFLAHQNEDLLEDLPELHGGALSSAMRKVPSGSPPVLC